MNKNKSIYIAGPMRGYIGFNYDAFNHAANVLRADGWTVYNPAELSDIYGTPEEIESDQKLLSWLMDEEQILIRDCADAILLLEGWQDSVGAKEELAVYLAAGKRDIKTELP